MNKDERMLAVSVMDDRRDATKVTDKYRVRFTERDCAQFSLCLNNGYTVTNLVVLSDKVMLVPTSREHMLSQERSITLTKNEQMDSRRLLLLLFELQHPTRPAKKIMGFRTFTRDDDAVLTVPKLPDETLTMMAIEVLSRIA